jgi:predicted ester cyclase
MSIVENKELIKKAAHALNNVHDRSGWFAMHADSVKAHGLAPEALGMEGMKAFYGGLLGGFPDLTIRIEDLVAEGDEVVWRVTAQGTHQGTFFGVPATGKKVAFGAQYTFRIEGGKIVERWSTIDRLSLLVQIGAVKMPGK